MKVAVVVVSLQATEQWLTHVKLISVTEHLPIGKILNNNNTHTHTHTHMNTHTRGGERERKGWREGQRQRDRDRKKHIETDNVMEIEKFRMVSYSFSMDLSKH